MSIYSDTLQQQTDQLVTDVDSLSALVNATPPLNDTAISSALDPVETDANNINTTITSADIPPDNTQIQSLVTQLLNQIATMRTDLAATPVDDPTITADGNSISETTANINWCVTNMSQQQVPDPAPVQPATPPWFSIPTIAPPPDGSR
jgi:hypothetical protein